MIAVNLSYFWSGVLREKTATPPPKKRPAPIFIGDAVQPFDQGTMLLSILRKDSEPYPEDDPQR